MDEPYPVISKRSKVLFLNEYTLLVMTLVTLLTNGVPIHDRLKDLPDKLKGAPMTGHHAMKVASWMIFAKKCPLKIVREGEVLNPNKMYMRHLSDTLEEFKRL